MYYTNHIVFGRVFKYYEANQICTLILKNNLFSKLVILFILSKKCIRQYILVLNSVEENSKGK